MVQYPRETAIKLTGNQSAQLKQIEDILNRFRHRLQRKVVGVIPPIPIFMHGKQPENGVLCKFILPISGTLQKLAIHIGKFIEKEVIVDVITRTAQAVKSHEILCTRVVTTVDLDTEVSYGTVVEVRALGGSDFTLGFLLLPERKALRIEHQLLDTVLALEEPNDADDEVR